MGKRFELDQTETILGIVIYYPNTRYFMWKKMVKIVKKTWKKKVGYNELPSIFTPPTNLRVVG